MINNTTLSCIASFVCIALACAVGAGCEKSERTSGVSWNDAVNAASASQSDAVNASSASQGAATNQEVPHSGGSSGADEVAFGSLNWSYGGVNGSRAVQSGVSISGLRMTPGMLYFTYGTDLSAWGLSYDAADALACLFVQKSDGSWVGGKFDWISSSRDTRPLGHTGGYKGWTLSGVPNPCKCAFVIVDKGLAKRSNVLVGTWSR